MVTLACGLKQRGHDVEVFIYFPSHSHFGDRVSACAIPVHEFRKGRGFSIGVLRRLSSLIRSRRYDIVLSYLGSPNVYAELSCIGVRSTRLVVSERGSHFGDASRISAWVKRTLHRLADHIVVNSASHAAWLQSSFPWMCGRLSVIYNGFDVESLASDPLPPRDRRDLRLISVARVHPGKNLEGLIEALRMFSDKHGWAPQITWAGRREKLTAADRAYCAHVDALLDATPQVGKAWQWLGERSDVPELLKQHHALIHPSLHEGLPNAVCEALATGRPVLASNVCDNAVLVRDGERGFLFEPTSPSSIVSALERLVALSDVEWLRMSHAAKSYAARELSAVRLIDHYEELFKRLAA